MEFKQSVRDLGIQLDDNLSLTKQINLVVKSCNDQIRNIYFIRKYLTNTCLRILVINLILSRIDYCNSIYVNMPKKVLKRLQVVQNKAARLATGSSYEERVTPQLIQLHWLPIKARIVFKLCCLVYLALQNQKPTYLSKLLTPTRRRLFVPGIKSSYGKRSFSYTGPSLYNSLPLEIKNATNVQSFKKKLKTHLFTSAYDLQTKMTKDEYKV